MDKLFVALASLLAVLPLATAFVYADPASDQAGGRLIYRAATPATDVTPWDVLSAYEYAPGLAGLPDAIRALEGKDVTLRGYLLTLRQWDDITEFCVVHNHMTCHFGMSVGIQSQVHVTLRKGERGLPSTTEPIEVKGVFRAIETKDDGILLSIFRLDDATARIIGY